jgi:hypothetical protein
LGAEAAAHAASLHCGKGLGEGFVRESLLFFGFAGLSAQDVQDLVKYMNSL